MRIPRFRPLTYVLVIPVLALPVLFFRPSVAHKARWVLKSVEPFSSTFFAYENWRHPWYNPHDAGDGKAARDIRLAYPMGIAEDREGNIYIGDRMGRYIWRVDPDGMAHILAGTGRRGLALPGKAREVSFGSPEGICLERDGSLLVADMFNHVVLRIRRGEVTRIAGTGEGGFAGDGGPAASGTLNGPYDVYADSRGDIYIADFYNNRIRMVDARGVIRTVAGTGEPGYAGDGGPALRARLNGPYSVHVDPDDNLLIGDSLNNAIRRVGRDGVIRTIAGDGKQGHSGDGGPATLAEFNEPQAMFAARDGRLLIDDEHNNCVRVLATDGCVRRLIGTGRAGYSEDGALAAEAAINDPEDEIVLHDGSILVAEGGNGRVLRISPDGRVSRFAGIGHRP